VERTLPWLSSPQEFQRLQRPLWSKQKAESGELAATRNDGAVGARAAGNCQHQEVAQTSHVMMSADERCFCGRWWCSNSAWSASGLSLHCCWGCREERRSGGHLQAFHLATCQPGGFHKISLVCLSVPVAVTWVWTTSVVRQIFCTLKCQGVAICVQQMAALPQRSRGAHKNDAGQSLNVASSALKQELKALVGSISAEAAGDHWKSFGLSSGWARKKRAGQCSW